MVGKPTKNRIWILIALLVPLLSGLLPLLGCSLPAPNARKMEETRLTPEQAISSATEIQSTSASGTSGSPASAGPTPDPTATLASPEGVASNPSPHPEDNSQDVGICHVFVIESEEQLGGMPFLIDIIYAGNDGLIQVTQERSDDTILSLGQQKLDVKDFLEVVSSVTPLPSVDQSTTSSGTTVLPEHFGPTLHVEIGLCDGTSDKWSGEPTNLPHSVARIVEHARELGQIIEPETLEPGQRYVRSQTLSASKAEQLRRANLVIDVTADQIEQNRTLEEAITYERRLIKVEEDQTLYHDIPLSFTQGRSAHIAYTQQVFQIRHLLTTER